MSPLDGKQTQSIFFKYLHFSRYYVWASLLDALETFQDLPLVYHSMRIPPEWGSAKVGPGQQWWAFLTSINQSTQVLRGSPDLVVAIKGVR
jgi:hypothetical protein